MLHEFDDPILRSATALESVSASHFRDELDLKGLDMSLLLLFHEIVKVYNMSFVPLNMPLLAYMQSKILARVVSKLMWTFHIDRENHNEARWRTRQQQKSLYSIDKIIHQN